MLTTKNITRLRRALNRVNRPIGFVPTMGALHEGHLSLVRRARSECDFVVASIFVNPAQFGPKEDYKKYPRNLNQDKNMLREEGVDLLFFPSAREIYPDNFSTYVVPAALADCLCGTSRPGHFRGVCTVVSKLFNIIGPDIAYFGRKDYQQAVIIERMARDLNFDIKIKMLPIVREKDGLAMSSRNKYLTPSQRIRALSLNRALREAKIMVGRGETDAVRIANQVKNILRGEVRIDYVKIVDPENLSCVRRVKNRALLALAVYVGRTRLIDNIILRGS